MTEYDEHQQSARRAQGALVIWLPSAQQVSKQTTPCEGKLQMQLIHAAHQHKVGDRHRLGHVVEAAPAAVERRRLLPERKIMLAVDHRFALKQYRLVAT
jgi:hypothetical protein